jgi:hypothetical protein
MSIEKDSIEQTRECDHWRKFSLVSARICRSAMLCVRHFRWFFQQRSSTIKNLYLWHFTLIFQYTLFDAFEANFFIPVLGDTIPEVLEQWFGIEHVNRTICVVVISVVLFFPISSLPGVYACFGLEIETRTSVQRLARDLGSHHRFPDYCSITYQKMLFVFLKIPG